MKIDKKLVVAANLALAAIVLYWFYSSLNFSEVTAALTKTNAFWLAPAVVCYALMNWTSAVRFKQLLSLKWSVLKTYFAHMQALLLSDVTPGRSGYAFILYRLRGQGKTGANARVLGIVLASDFLVRALLIVASIALFTKDFLAAGAFLAALSLIALLLFWKRVKLVTRLLAKIPSFGKRLARAYESVFVERVGGKEMLFALYVSLVGAILRGGAWWFVLYALGYTAQLYEVVALCALLTSLSFIPLSIAGLGVQEATGAVLFSTLLGAPLALTGALMVLIRIVEAGSDLVFGVKEFFG